MKVMFDNDRLAAGFAALTAEGDGRQSPFRWQMRLLRRLIDDDLPKAVDIPTGLGKTSTMALWLIALAEGAKLPRRLVYVVDRRAVVDQATRFAERLRRNMPTELAARLCLKDSILPISTLRGGFADNRDWLEDPASPAIVVGTIDMIGSRLLFEGYGVSRGMRPYHAGFLGVDALVLLDEAHLCPPFEALLRQIAAHRDGKLGAKPGHELVTPPFHLLSLSATGRDAAGKSSESVFRLEQRDREESTVHQRLTAQKRLRVAEITDGESLTKCMAERAIPLGDGDPPSRVLVYCDRRKDAIAVKGLIDKEWKRRLRAGERTLGWESELLVGERRVHERTELETWLERHGFLGGSKALPRTATYLVATSAGEVGVDLDADHMVCDLVAWERMVQRLGRVNRRGGEHRSAEVDVFSVRPELKANPKKAEEEEHKKNLAKHDRRMAPLCRLPSGDDGRHDASPSALVELRLNHTEIVDTATTPAPLHPELTRPLLDAWAMTSLSRHEGRPEVAPWLRGWEEDEEPHTDVVWRKYLPFVSRDSEISASPAMAAEFFRSAPIHATERLEAISGRVFDWLLKRATKVGRHDQDPLSTIGDKEVVAILMDRAGDHLADVTLGGLRRLAAPAKSMNKSAQRERDRRKREWKERLLPGALLVVDARVGGLRDGMLDETSKSEAVTADADEDWRGRREESSTERPRPLIRFRVQYVTDVEDEEGLAVSAALDDWRHVRTFEISFEGNGVARRGLAVYKWPDESADEDSRSIVSAPQTLTDHAEQVAVRAWEMATRLALPSDEIKAFSIAARLHDDGKAAARWQDAMNAPKDDGRPYAKTCGGGNVHLLEGYRHEFGSLLKAEWADLPERTRDLILHLIAAHHGNARPFISSSGCEDGPPSLLESSAGDAALRFARLQKQHGPWRLAWLEAVLRAADQSVSREWARQQRRASGG